MLDIMSRPEWVFRLQNEKKCSAVGGATPVAEQTHWTLKLPQLTHWGRATHICVSNLIIIGSNNGLSPDRRQAIIRTNAGILLIGPLGINFNEILIGIQTLSFTNMHLKMSSAKWRPLFLGLNVLRHDRRSVGIKKCQENTYNRNKKWSQMLVDFSIIWTKSARTAEI